MKSTGIVRRIDGLGRVVLPKEIRKTLKLDSGDLLEISVEKEIIVLQKYSPLSTFDRTTSAVANSLTEILGLSVVITDKSAVVCATDKAKHLKGEKLCESMVKTIEDKSSFIINSSESGTVKKITENGNEMEFVSQIIVPVLGVENEPLGAVVILDTKVGGQMGLKEITLANFSSKMLVAEVDA